MSVLSLTVHHGYFWKFSNKDVSHVITAKSNCLASVVTTENRPWSCFLVLFPSYSLIVKTSWRKLTDSTTFHGHMSIHIELLSQETSIERNPPGAQVFLGSILGTLGREINSEIHFLNLVPRGALLRLSFSQITSWVSVIISLCLYLSPLRMI